MMTGSLLAAPFGEGSQAVVTENAASTNGWTLVWHDEFDGDQIDTSKWNHVAAGGGFGNNELQHYTARPENSFIENGNLVIQAMKEDYAGDAYTSAKLYTQGKGDWTYGRFEIRAKLPQGQGIWPAIWMMPTDYTMYGQWPTCGEIDIMENVGYAPSTVWGTLHYGDPWKNSGVHYTLPEGQKLADDFHVYAMEWTPGRFAWYFDDVCYGEQTDWYTSAPGAMWPAPFDRDFYLQMNVAVGGNWPGYPNETTVFPQRMVVDYVRVYQFNGEYPSVPVRSAAPPHLRSREPLPDGNLIYNGTFDEDTAHWRLRSEDEARAVLTAVDGALRVSSASVPPPSGSPVVLYHEPFRLERGASYILSLEAYSEAPRDLTLRIGKASQHWDNYSGDLTAPLVPEKQQFTFPFKMRADTDFVARLAIHLGAGPESVVLDNVSLRVADQDIPFTIRGATKLEAEQYDRMAGISVEPCAEGGMNVGWMEAGDWLEFNVDVQQAGTYRVEHRFSNGGEPGVGVLQVDGTERATIHYPRTMDWQRWETVEHEMHLAAGPQRLRFVCRQTGFNLNYIRFSPIPQE